MAPKGLLALHMPDLNKYYLTSLGELNKTLYAYFFFFLDGCCMLNSNYTITQKVEEGFFFNNFFFLVKGI